MSCSYTHTVGIEYLGYVVGMSAVYCKGKNTVMIRWIFASEKLKPWHRKKRVESIFSQFFFFSDYIIKSQLLIISYRFSQTRCTGSTKPWSSAI